MPWNKNYLKIFDGKSNSQKLSPPCKSVQKHNVDCYQIHHQLSKKLSEIKIGGITGRCKWFFLSRWSDLKTWARLSVTPKRKNAKQIFTGNEHEILKIMNVRCLPMKLVEIIELYKFWHFDLNFWLICC